MKKMTTREVPAKTETVIDHIKCELCDNTTKHPCGGFGTSWSPAQYEVLDVEVSMSTGSSYPEGGSKETVVLDICPRCFTEKLLPWFQSQGGVPRKEDSDW